MNKKKRVGIITIHGIDNFGSLCQAYATQRTVESIGYKCEIINYKYPNTYHKNAVQMHTARAKVLLNFWHLLRSYTLGQVIRYYIYRIFISKGNQEKKHKLYEEVRKRILKTSKVFIDKEMLSKTPPQYDIYLTGSDQVWNPRYLFEDTTFLLSFVNSDNKIAFSASFGTTEIDAQHQELMRPLLSQYRRISTRESSGVNLVRGICGKKAICTCDPTLLLSGNEWKSLFDAKPLIDGEYILCYILTYTADPYPYAYKFVKHIRKILGMKVVFIDEGGFYWNDLRNKSFQVYGPNEIINLFSNASFIISSSFHGAAFSVNFKKDFYSIFPKGVKDERQESLLKIVGAEDRFIRVGDPFPTKEELHIKNWKDIDSRLQHYVSMSKEYLRESLSLCSK